MTKEQFIEADELILEIDAIESTLKFDRLSILKPTDNMPWNVRNSTDLQDTIKEANKYLEDAIRLYLHARLDNLKSELEAL